MNARFALGLLIGAALAACGLDIAGAPVEQAPPPAPGPETGPPTLPPPSIVLDAAAVDADTGTPPPTCTPSSDLRSDPKNCGACGRDCRGAACNESVCEPAVIMQGLSSPHGLALGPTDIYVANNNSGVIVSRPKDGSGTTTNVFATGQAPRALALNGNRLYWPEQTKLRSVKLDGTGDVNRPLQGGTAVVIVDQRVYYNEIGNGGHIRWSAFDLSDQNEVTGAAAGSGGIAADNDFLYWTEGDNVTRRVRSQAEVSKVWSPSEDGPESIAVAGDFVYWTTKTAIRTSKKGDSASALDLFKPAGKPRALIHDGKHLYWFDTDAKTLMRGNPSGGTALVLAKSVRQEDFVFTTAIATDDTWVYWLSSDDDTVQRIAK